MNKGILIFYHCRSNTGYAIESLEKVFFKMALEVTKDISKIHIGYLNLEGGKPNYLPINFNQVIEIDTQDNSRDSLRKIGKYIKKNQVEVIWGFDQPVSAPAYKIMRKAGVKLFVSYWGAPMSSLNSGLKLFGKKIEVFLRRYKPDYYIFESDAMAKTAQKGRGISSNNTCVIPLGVNTNQFKPNPEYINYAYKKFLIPKDRKIIVYSGHMEERKGVRIIIKAAKYLVGRLNRKDVHFLFLGNKNGEEIVFDSIYKGTSTEKYITFGGYQEDIYKIMPSCYLGVIASTGWDSFTMSSVEMASSGLPLIVSELQGLCETIEKGKTGFLFQPGDYTSLSNKINLLLDHQSLHKKMSIASRERAISKFSEDRQLGSLIRCLENLCKRKLKN